MDIHGVEVLGVKAAIPREHLTNSQYPLRDDNTGLISNACHCLDGDEDGDKRRNATHDADYGIAYHGDPCTLRVVVWAPQQVLALDRCAH